MIRYEFTGVTGAHTVSVLWTAPDKRVYGWSEELLTDTDGSEYIWFGLDFSAFTELCTGEWNALLFIDGGCVLKNSFNVYYASPIYIKNRLNISV